MTLVSFERGLACPATESHFLSFVSDGEFKNLFYKIFLDDNLITEYSSSPDVIAFSAEDWDLEILRDSPFYCEGMIF